MDEEHIIPAPYGGENKKPSSSNTGLLTIIFVLLLILVAGGAYLFGNNRKTAQNIEVAPTPTESVTPTEVLGASETPTPTETPSFKATSAVVAVAPTEVTTCPTTFNFTALISASGAGTVKYQWEKNDGSGTAVETLNFLGTGTKTVKTSWKLTNSYTGWEKLVILSPNTLESNLAEFKQTCPLMELKQPLKVFTIPTTAP